MYLGVLEGIAEAIASLMKLASGYWADRTRRQFPLVLLGYSISTCRSLIGLAVTPWQVLAIRFSDRFGKGIRTAPRDAWLASYTDSQSRSRIFGFHRAMDNVGATVAPLLATVFLYFYPGNYRVLFLLTLIPGFLVIYFVFKARKYEKSEASLTAPLPKISFKDIARLPKRFYYFLFVLFLFTLGNSADAFLILRLKEVGVPEYAIPSLWAALNLVKVLSSLWGGGFADRVGAKTSVILGWIIYSLAYLGFAFVTDPFIMGVIFIFYGVFFGLTEGPEKALVTELAPKHLRGTAFGFYHLVMGVGLLPASLICGVLWQKSGASLALGFAVIVSAVSTLLFLKVKAGSQLKPGEMLAETVD